MNKLKVTTAILLCVSILLFSATTYSWFKDGNAYGFPTNFGGSAMPAYFESGDGTEDDPYVISKPVHLYNLAWLQYLGYFNMREDFSNGNPQNHFKLTDNIDMRGRAVPPIGTAEYPFVGVFQGNGKTVKNVYIANKKGNDLLKVYPTKAVFDASGMLRFVDNSDEVSILGLFGVTGEYNDYVTEYAKAHTAFDSSKMKISGFYADKLHVYSKSTQTLAGLLAGYVGCDFSNLGVYRCDMSFIPSATGIQSVTGDNSVVSLYSVVGAYNKDVVSWSDDGSSGPGEGAGFGDSIDMRTLNRRLTYMVAKIGPKKTGYNYSAESADWNLYWYKTGSSEFYWNNVGLTYVYSYLCNGSILPLGINEKDMGLTIHEGDYGEILSSEGLHYNNYYANSKSEIVGNKNTGYIVGGGNKNNGYIVTRVQPLASGGTTYEKGVYKSLGVEKDSITTYDQKKFTMLTITNSNTTVAIRDSYNTEGSTTPFGSDIEFRDYNELNLKDYAKVRKNFDTAMAGSQMVHGFHFYRKISETAYESTSGSVLLYDKITQNLESHTNYELIKGGINFTLHESGNIKTILGAFFSYSYNSLFDLYKVERDSSDQITEVHRIRNVYKDSDDNVFYDYELTDTSNYTKVFSLEDLTRNGGELLMCNAAYYFEIPVKEGDYVIGVDKNSSPYNAYLMYLDIGANGSGETGGETGKPYTMDSIDFVNTSTVTVDENNVPVYTDYDAVFFKLSGVDGLTETPYVVFRRNEQLSADGKLKVVYTVISVAIAPSPEDLSAPGTLTPSLDDD